MQKRKTTLSLSFNQCCYLYLNTWFINSSSLWWIFSLTKRMKLYFAVRKSTVPEGLPKHIWICLSFLPTEKEKKIERIFLSLILRQKLIQCVIHKMKIWKKNLDILRVGVPVGGRVKKVNGGWKDWNSSWMCLKPGLEWWLSSWKDQLSKCPCGVIVSCKVKDSHSTFRRPREAR